MANQKSVDRAERIATLFTSRNSLIRREAAEAFSSLSLYSRHTSALLRSYFRNPDWNARITAANALNLMLKSLPICTESIKPSIERLSDLDFASIVQIYYPLLSCDIELMTKVNQCKLLEQRRFVDEHLDYRQGVGLSSSAFISETDFRNVTVEKQEKKVKLQSDLNLLNDSYRNVSYETEDARCVQQICEEFLEDLVDAKWDIRHGAALAIKEIICSSVNRLTADYVDLLTIKLFHVLTLDNFIDFSSGRCAVGPVREAVSTCLSSLMTAFATCDDYIDIVARNVQVMGGVIDADGSNTRFSALYDVNKSWFPRQAALLVLKYHFAGPCFLLKFNEFHSLMMIGFNDVNDEVNSSALSAATALFCRADIPPEVAVKASNIESTLYRIIETTSNSENQILDIDTTLVDLLSLLRIWFSGNKEHILPYVMLTELADLLNPLNITRSSKIIDIIITSFSRLHSINEESVNELEECATSLLFAMFRLLLFLPPQDSDTLIRSCINAASIISETFLILKHLPSGIVLTIGRWCAVVFVDSRSADIDLQKFNVCRGESQERVQLLCGEELRSFSDTERVHMLLVRKLRISQFLAPIISCIFAFPSKIGNQSLNDAIQLLIKPFLSSPIVLHRFGGSLIVYSWFTYDWICNRYSALPSLVIDYMKCCVHDSSFAYTDETVFYNYLEGAYKGFREYCKKNGVEEKAILDIEACGDSIDTNASKIYELCSALMTCDSVRSALSSRYQCFKEALSTTNTIFTSNVTRVNALFVSSILVVHPEIAIESKSLNPLIKPLIEVMKFEENSVLARNILCVMSILFRMTLGRKPVPHVKVLKQIVIGLTTDLFSLRNSAGLNVLMLSRKPLVSTSARARNAEFILRDLVRKSAVHSLDVLLDFRNHEHADTIMYMHAYSIYLDEIRLNGFVFTTNVVDIIENCKQHLLGDDSLIRLCASRCLTQIARLDGELRCVLQMVILPLQERLRKSELSESARAGFMELIVSLSAFNFEIIGGLRVLAPITLRFMTDTNAEIREAAAHAFRCFVPLMALKLNKSKANSSLNDKADEDFSESYIDLLLSAPHQLPPIDLKRIHGLNSIVKLRHYQQEGIRWMCYLEELGLCGILADDMGLGKTLQTLCLLALKLNENPSGRVLILCPSTLVNHWCHEWSTYFPLLKPFYKVEDAYRGYLKPWTADDCGVMIASFHSLRSSPKWREIEWFYVILDEGHAIRNPSTQLFKAVTSLRSQNRLILSGTPVQNSPSDLWALFHFLMPDYLGSMKEFRTTYLNSINACKHSTASSNEIELGQVALERLHKAVLPFVLRRLKSDVLEDLPDKIVQDYPCMMTSLQREYYQHIVNLCKLNQESAHSEGLSPLETMSELRKCCVHPALVHAKASISTCVKPGRTIEESGKLIALRELIRGLAIGYQGNEDDDESTLEDVGLMISHRRRRALIFCQRVSTIHLLSELLKSNKLGSCIRFDVLDSTIPANQRHSIAENFNRDTTIDILLLSSIGGEGLNLIGADVVIFIEHDWNPVKDLQAMDRAHRIGQKNTVNVYRLITESTIEEKIMRYQKFKSDTANALVGADNRSLQAMATEQLVELFALGPSQSTMSSSPAKDSRSKGHNEKKTYSSMEQKFDLEELWDQSQYDCYDAVNIHNAMSETVRRSSEIDSNIPPSKKAREGL